MSRIFFAILYLLPVPSKTCVASSTRGLREVLLSGYGLSEVVSEFGPHWLISTQVDDDRGGLITVHELHQTIREIGQELSIDDVRFSRVCSHERSDDEPSFSLQPY